MPSIAVGIASPTGPNPKLFAPAIRFGRLVGLDSFLVFDHLQDFAPRSVWRSDRFTWQSARQRSPHAQTDATAVLASLAHSAGRVRLGTSVTEPLRHHPVAIAQSALTLATLTRRPPILGIGAGERMNTAPYGIPFDQPVSRLEEALQILRLCLDSPGSLDFSGRFCHLNPAPVDLAVPGRTPQIWVAAQGPRMLQIAGRYADGWLPAYAPSPERYQAAHADLTAAARDAGRDPSAITPSLQAGAVVAATRAEAEKAVNSRFLRFNAVATWSAQTWQAVGLEHPFGPSFRGFVDFIPETVDRSALETAMDEVPGELLRSGVLWGTADDVVDAVRGLGDAGLRHISLIPLSYPISRKLAAYFWWALARIIRGLRNY